MQNQVYPYPLSVNTTSQFTSQQIYPFGHYGVTAGGGAVVTAGGAVVTADGGVVGAVLGAALGAVLGAPVGFSDDPPPDK